MYTLYNEYNLILIYTESAHLMFDMPKRHMIKPPQLTILYICMPIIFALYFKII